MKTLSIEEYYQGILNGNRSMLSKSITLIESTNPNHHELSQALIEKCIPHSGLSYRIGISGVPGVGKSTFIEALGLFLIEKEQKKVAVLAIDPSSNKTGGSILGDKTRMNRLSVQENAFIRPSPSSGVLGGVARATRESIILCEAAGYDTILIETVGVGQSEIEVKEMVDFFLLLMLAGAGDELQGIKRGIMEIADAIVINKADGNNEVPAKNAAQDYKNALHLFPANENGWIPRVELCSAIEHRNIDQVWKIMDDYFRSMHANGFFENTRRNQSKFWLKHAIESQLSTLFYTHPQVKEQLKTIETEVVSGKLSPVKAASLLLELFKN
ncbi:MAG: methylmalonyl Co-A mutase-associated GTPase MeaB [Flavobacteriales bacterium]|nr:methylmalonyl Co-A mutase-associated GTPase MeaB [Flavobacteriales bacterium]